MKFLFLPFLFFFPVFSLAGDDIRNNLFVSIGSGVNVLQSEFLLIDESLESFTDAGVSAQLRVGSHITKKISLYSAINQRSFFNHDQQGSFYLTDTAMGLQYYFSKYIRTAYILGSYASAVTSLQDSPVNFGRTWELGVGYEVFKNWQVELAWRDTKSKVNHSVYESYESQNLQFTLNFVWY